MAVSTVEARKGAAKRPRHKVTIVEAAQIRPGGGTDSAVAKLYASQPLQALLYEHPSVVMACLQTEANSEFPGV